MGKSNIITKKKEKKKYNSKLPSNLKKQLFSNNLAIRPGQSPVARSRRFTKFFKKQIIFWSPLLVVRSRLPRFQVVRCRPPRPWAASLVAPARGDRNTIARLGTTEINPP